ncbi:MAG: glycosyltransferase family 4 protein [Candidatus Acidiferrales bacterium]
MKVWLPVIRNFSGADIYFQRLAEGIRARGWAADLRFFPHIMEFLPYTALQPFLPRHHDCALIHTKAEYGWLFREPGRPLVVTLGHSVHDQHYEKHKNRFQRLYHNLKWRPNIARSFAVADRLVAISRFVAKQIREQYGREDTRVIYNGVDVNFFRPLDPPAPRANGPVRLLFLGNLTPRKGFPLLAPIMERLGKGYLLEYTTGLRTRGHRPPHAAMRPLGRLQRQALLEAYQRCDILLFPSRLEGFGYPVAEAMACGKPVVSSNCSSLPELLADGQGGYLCPADDVEAFAVSVQRLGLDPELRQRMGAFNRAKAEKEFSLAGCIEQYLALYRELL